MQTELCREEWNTPKLQWPHGESTNDINTQPHSLPPPTLLLVTPTGHGHTGAREHPYGSPS